MKVMFALRLSLNKVRLARLLLVPPPSSGPAAEPHVALNLDVQVP